MTWFDGDRVAIGARGRWLSPLAIAVMSGVVGARPIAPHTEEAVARGVVYTMQDYPQTAGVLGFGCGFADLDGDGDPDIIILGAADGHVGIFENNGSGYFIDRSSASGIPLLPQASGFAAADYDGDGLIDLYLTQTGLSNVLVKNNGGFQFTDVTATAQVGDDGAGTGACFGDFNGDNRLDLYVCNYNGIPPRTELIDNKLYRNSGGGRFQDVSVAQTVDDEGLGFQAVWFDYDRDGDVDLYLSNDRGHLPPQFRPNQLWRNDGGQLVNVSVGSGTDLGLFSMGVACGDFDGNGWPDLYCTNVAGYEDGFNPLFLNGGPVIPPFVESSAAAGVDHWITSWGSIFYDFDNNGYQDLYVNNMFLPNSLYINNGAFPCVEVAGAANVTANAGVSFSSAVADVDNDGDLDLLVNNLAANVELFINQEGHQRRWIKYHMVGQGANLFAVGGNIDTRTGARWQLREILAGGNGYLGQNELTVHVGLGDAIVADEVVVAWPGGQTLRTLTDLPSNETWTLYPPERLGDADGNGIVDDYDCLVFAACYAGGFQPGCEMMDFDGNSVIDRTDLDAFLSLNLNPADVNGDGVVNVLDLIDVLLCFGLPAVPGCEGEDVNEDGSVNVLDLIQVLLAFGQGCAP